MKYICIIVYLLLTCACVANATEQAPDVLLYKGDTLILDESPLELFFADRKDSPARLGTSRTTSNWRGFIATWRIENYQLYLIDIKPSDSSISQDVKRVYLRRWFRPDAKGRVKASWFTGQLLLADPASNLGGFFWSTYLCRWNITVKQGNLETLPLPAEVQLWKNLPLQELKQQYCEVRSFMNTSERHYAGINDKSFTQVWVKIDAISKEPVTIISADTPELASAALRIVKQYISEHPLVGTAAERPWALPLIFGADGLICSEASVDD